MHAWMHTCAHTHTRRQTEGRTDGRTDLHTYRLHTGSRIPHWCMHVDIDRDVASCCEEGRERDSPQSKHTWRSHIYGLEDHFRIGHSPADAKSREPF